MTIFRKALTLAGATAAAGALLLAPAAAASAGTTSASTTSVGRSTRHGVLLSG